MHARAPSDDKEQPGQHVTASASVHQDPFWVAARSVNESLVSPTTPSSWMLASELFEFAPAHIKQQRIWEPPVAALGVSQVVYTGAERWMLVLEVHTSHSVLGDDTITLGLHLATNDAGQLLVPSAATAQALATDLCRSYTCGAAAPAGTTTAEEQALLQHLQCAVSGLQAATPEQLQAIASHASGLGSDDSDPYTGRLVELPLRLSTVTKESYVCHAATLPIWLSSGGAAALPQAPPARAALAGVAHEFCSRFGCPCGGAHQRSALDCFQALHGLLETQLMVHSGVLHADLATPRSPFASTVDRLVQHVQWSIAQANAGTSRLTHRVLTMHGMSSPRGRHLLNNLASQVGTRYLEVGSFQGSTFVSALYGNAGAVQHAVAIDNFVLSTAEAFKVYTRELLGSAIPRKLLEKDCFKVTAEDLVVDARLPQAGRFNFYLYDGDHSEVAQHDAYTYYDAVLEPVFITVVDDWNWVEVQQGTYRAFQELGYKMVYNQVLSSAENADQSTWWNGLLVAVVVKEGRE